MGVPIAPRNHRFYVALPATKSVLDRHGAGSPPTHSDVDLLPCNRPEGRLEQAPRTSLRADSVQENWEGFWCLADDRYYTRCTRSDGSQQWYGIGDSRRTGVLPLRRTSYPPAARVPGVRRAWYVSVRDEQRKLTNEAPRKLTDQARRTVMLVSRVGRRSILVGRRGGVR
jgi:hypothetical protein